MPTQIACFKHILSTDTCDTIYFLNVASLITLTLVESARHLVDDTKNNSD